jgi:hypothetical protein
MKPYREIVHEMAENVFGAYLDGAMGDEWHGVSYAVPFLAMAYEKTDKQIMADIRTEYEVISAKHYSKYGAKNA